MSFLSTTCCSNYTSYMLINICMKSMMISSKQPNIHLPNYSSNGNYKKLNFSLSPNIYLEDYYLSRLSNHAIPTFSRIKLLLVNSTLFVFFSLTMTQDKGENYRSLLSVLRHRGNFQILPGSKQKLSLEF